MHNEGEPRDTTLGFRCPESMLHLVRAAAARRGVLVSDWLRGATETVLHSELLSSDVNSEAAHGIDDLQERAR